MFDPIIPPPLFLSHCNEGENWIDENYNDIDGWELPVSWITSVPSDGHLTMNYSSTDEGCKPVWQERRALLQYVLCDVDAAMEMRNEIESLYKERVRQRIESESIPAYLTRRKESEEAETKKRIEANEEHMRQKEKIKEEEEHDEQLQKALLCLGEAGIGYAEFMQVLQMGKPRSISARQSAKALKKLESNDDSDDSDEFESDEESPRLETIELQNELEEKEDTEDQVEKCVLHLRERLESMQESVDLETALQIIFSEFAKALYGIPTGMEVILAWLRKGGVMSR